MLEVSKLAIHHLRNEYPFVSESVLQAGYRFWPDPESQPLIIVRDGNSPCIFMYSTYFNGAMMAILRSVRELGDEATVPKVVSLLHESEEIFPNQSGLSREELIVRLSAEYVFIGTEARRLIVPILGRIRKNYVQRGLAHVLLYHHGRLPSIFAPSQNKSVFPGDPTINEILGAIVTVVVEGTELDSDDVRSMLSVPVKFTTPTYDNTDPYLLVADKADSEHVFILVTFYPDRD